MNTQKVAVVTGASQGIGAALVAAYRKLGHAVVANSRSMPPSSDSMVLAVPGDIAEPEVAARVVDEGLAAFGRVDTLVNNAGVTSASRSPSTPPRTTTWSPASICAGSSRSPHGR